VKASVSDGTFAAGEGYSNKPGEIHMTSSSISSSDVEKTDSASRGGLREKAGAAVSKANDAATRIATDAKESASSLASEATASARGILTQQVGVGADLVGHLAGSIRVGAADLERNSPQIADFVREAADRMESFSNEIRGQSIEQLARRTTDFARERPVIVFGAAAACGFVLLRLFKAANSNAARGVASRPGAAAPRNEAHAPAGSPSYGTSHGS
jgi:ElaB/YqjD/DUF883 family membrane-anchored ribosome-binding protein